MMLQSTGPKRVFPVALGVLVLALAMAVAAPDRASAGCVGATTTFEFGDTVTESCTFDGNMKRSDTGTDSHGLIVGASGITIDGAGYSLDGEVKTCVSGETNDAGIYSLGKGSVTIRNLEILNFCHGIDMRGAGATIVTGNVIECCEIHDNGDDTSGSQTHGIKWNSVGESKITNCKVYNQGGDPTASGPPGGMGIYLCKGDDNEWSYNEVYNNKKAGLFMRCAPWRTWLHHNYAHDNNFAGIRGQCIKNYDGLAEYNYCINDKKGPGIMYGGPIDDPDGLGPYPNVVQYNTCKWNYTYGIEFSREAWWAELWENTACENDAAGSGYEDIYVQDYCTVTGADHNTCDTAYGFDDASATGGGCEFACASVVDSDGDGIRDYLPNSGDPLDNCRLTPNSGQEDSDGDGYGNACDADLNNDGTVNRSDLRIFKAAYGDQCVGNGCVDADFDGSGKVDRLDYRTFKGLYGDTAPFE